MTLWELSACVDGWNKAHGAEPAMDYGDFDDLLQRNADFIAKGTAKGARD